MAHTPGFAHDIFISFSDEDNLVPAGETCWVAQFPEHLEIWLRSRGLKGLDIWWDKKWLLTKLLSGTTGVPLHDADKIDDVGDPLAPEQSPKTLTPVGTALYDTVSVPPSPVLPARPLNPRSSWVILTSAVGQ